jgi:hypothetical protein
VVVNPATETIERNVSLEGLSSLFDTQIVLYAEPMTDWVGLCPTKIHNVCEKYSRREGEHEVRRKL